MKNTNECSKVGLFRLDYKCQNSLFQSLELKYQVLVFASHIIANAFIKMQEMHYLIRFLVELQYYIGVFFFPFAANSTAVLARVPP